VPKIRFVGRIFSVACRRSFVRSSKFAADAAPDPPGPSDARSTGEEKISSEGYAESAHKKIQTRA
jgi:hypothetical protein